MEKKKIKIVAKKYLNDLFNSFDDVIFEKIDEIQTHSIDKISPEHRKNRCGNP